MLSYLADFENHFGPLRLFRSHAFGPIMAAVTAAFIGFLIGPALDRATAAVEIWTALRPTTARVIWRSVSTRKTRPRWAGFSFSPRCS